MAESVLYQLNLASSVHDRQIKSDIAELPLGHMCKKFRRGGMNALHLNRRQALNRRIETAGLFDFGENHQIVLAKYQINLARLAAPTHFQQIIAQARIFRGHTRFGGTPGKIIALTAGSAGRISAPRRRAVICPRGYFFASSFSASW